MPSASPEYPDSFLNQYPAASTSSINKFLLPLIMIFTKHTVFCKRMWVVHIKSNAQGSVHVFVNFQGCTYLKMVEKEIIMSLLHTQADMRKRASTRAVLAEVFQNCGNC